MNLLGKDLAKLQAHWRERYGTDAPMKAKPPTAEERDCACLGSPQGCGRPKCPRRTP